MKEKKNKPLVRYDPSSDVLYIATRKGVEEEFTEVAPESTWRWMIGAMSWALRY